jgi:hypothetical protein
LQIELQRRHSELGPGGSYHDDGEGKLTRREPLLGCEMVGRDLTPVLVETICLTKDLVVLIVNDVVEDAERHRVAQCLEVTQSLSEEVEDVARCRKPKGVLADGMSSPQVTMIDIRRDVFGVGRAPIIKVLVDNVCAEKNFTNTRTLTTINVRPDNSTYQVLSLTKDRMSSKVNKTLKTVHGQYEATLSKESLTEWLGGDSIKLLAGEAKFGKGRVISMVHDQLLQLSGQTVEGGWRTLTSDRVVTTGTGRGHVVVGQGVCVLVVFTRSHHLVMGGQGKLGQTHVLQDRQKEMRRT